MFGELSMHGGRVRGQDGRTMEYIWKTRGKEVLALLGDTSHALKPKASFRLQIHTRLGTGLPRNGTHPRRPHGAPRYSLMVPCTTAR